MSETLEQTAEKLFPTTTENDALNYQHVVMKSNWLKGAQIGAKWQQERSYSKEDLKKAFDSAREFNSLDGVVDVHIVLPMGGDMSDLQPLHFTFDEWFDEFKKK